MSVCFFQVHYVRNQLIALDRVKSPEEDDRTRKFVRSYLRRDGCFIIRMVAKNASEVIAAELISGLWDEYKDNEKRVNRLFGQEPTDMELMTSTENAGGAKWRQ
jgi:hypothetical protein